jgi:hypothetical protein
LVAAKDSETIFERFFVRLLVLVAKVPPIAAVVAVHVGCQVEA